ncbi:MAG: lysylphosphatidylglycerol synthase transmembrane domain-containing protein [Mariprofundaceae bacterium]
MSRSLLLPLKLLISAALLAALLYFLDLGSVLERLAQAELSWVMAALLCLLVGQFLSALRWAWLARGLGLEVRLFRKVYLYFLGMFLSLFLPSIIGGDVARGVLLAKGREGKGWEAAASIILERLNGVLALVLVVAACLFFLVLPLAWKWTWWVLVICMCLAVAGYQYLHPRLPDMAASWRKLSLTSHAFQRAWWKALPVSITFQVLVVQAHVFLGLAVGLSLSWPEYGVMVCLVALASALPLSFNGFGIREGGYVGFAAYFGANGDVAAAMAALWVAVLVLASLPGGLVLWRLGGLKERGMKEQN